MQDISPNNNQQSATNTNTMNPRNLTAQSAGSISPTIISQSNADRRRRAANAREERRQESLAANVERAEIEKEYRRLRDAEEAANRRAEARKESAKRETVTFYEGGINSPLKVRRVSVGEYLGEGLKGASEPIKVPEELRQLATMDQNDEAGRAAAAYLGLDKFRDAVNDLLKTEAEEKAKIQRVKEFATLTVSSYNQSASAAAAYTPMTESARIAHQRAIENPNTSSEIREQLTADLKRDSEYAQTHGVQLSAAEEKHLSEIYRGGASVPVEQKRIAAAYLSAAGSTYGKEDFNRAQSNVYVNQTEKARDALLQRYQARDEINNPNNTTATTEALRANMAGAAEVLSDLTQSRSRLGLENAEKRGLSAAAEKQFEKQNAKVRAAMKDNPYVAADTALYAESILRVLEGDKVNLSNEAFLREQGLTERRFGGTDWTSAGGESAADAVAKGKDKTSYSMFKSAGEDDAEFILIDSAGKKRYTLKQEDSGAFKIFGWSGDIVASSESAQGLPGALRNLNIPFDEKSFNVFRPDSDSTVVTLADETDISGIGTAAAFKASVLGTFRGNEEIMKVEGERRAAEETVARQTALSNLDAALTDSQGYTLRIMGEPVDMPKTTAARKEEPNILSGAAVMASTMAGALPGVMAAKGAYDLVSNPPKTIFDEWAAEDAVADSSKRVEGLTYGGRDGERDVGGLFGSAREYVDVVDSLVESGELVAGSKKKSVLLSDEENPENSVYTYTDLEWSEKASKESVEKFFNAESKLKSAGEGLSAAISDYNAKVEKKEKISNDVWWGVPKVARDFTQTYLPEAEKVYPFVNAAELLGSDLRRRITVNEFLKDAVSGNLKYDSPSDFVQKEVYEKDPVVSWLYNYRYLRDEPVNFAVQLGMGYAAPYVFVGGAKAVGKTVPYIRGTVVDPITNTQLAQKSSKYVSDLLKSIPPSPVSLRIGSAKLITNSADPKAAVDIDSLLLIRRWGNYEKATPIASRLFFEKSGNTEYVKGLNHQIIKPRNLAYEGQAYVLRDPFDITLAEKALENVGDTKSLHLLKLFDEQSRILQHSDTISMQKITPHVAEVLKSKGITDKVDDISKAVVDSMSEWKAFTQSSMTQRAIGKELNDAALFRTPRDIDMFTETVDNLIWTLYGKMNRAAGKDIVYVKDGKLLLKSDDSELFDIHELGSYESTSRYSPGGHVMERLSIGDTDITTVSLQTQMLNKRSGFSVLVREPRTYAGTGAFDVGGEGVGYLMPFHAGRVKDLEDFYAAGRVIANQMEKKGNKHAKEFRDIHEEILDFYGEETAKKIRTNYDAQKQYLESSGKEVKEFNGEIIPAYDTPYYVRKPSPNVNPIHLSEKSYKNMEVEGVVKWTKANATADNLVGMPIGIYLTAGFASTAAAKFAEGEDASKEYISGEVVPMLIGGYFGGKGAQSLAKELAFRGRTNYFPIEKITPNYVLKGVEDYPLWEYDNTFQNKIEYINQFGRGGGAMKRAEDAFGVSSDAEYAAYRAENRQPKEKRPNVREILPTKYLHEDKNIVYSGSAGSWLSPKFTGALNEDVYTKTIPFGLNAFTSQYQRPSGFLILGKKPVANVSHGMGTTKTAEYIKKFVSPDQYQAVSGKTAQYARIIAEDENTIQPGAEMQILNKSYYTTWEGNKIAMDVVGIIPKGAKKTDVIATFNPKGYKEKTPQEEIETLDINNLIKETTLITASDKIDVNTWYPVLNARLKHYKSQLTKVAKTNNSKEIADKITQINELKTNVDSLVKIIRGRPRLTTRGRGGNPFTANAFMPDTKQSRQSGFTKPTQATTAERETPRAFTETRKTQSTGTTKSKSSFESVFSKSSLKTTKTSERKATTTGTGVFGVGSSSPIFTSSKSSPSRVTETFSSGIPRNQSRSESSIGRSTSRGTRAKSSRSKTSSSSVPKIFDTPMKRKTPKLRWDKNKDRRKKSYYNVFTVENVDLPILRGEEALTGQTLPKQELPANKKTVYQFGNIFTTKKPREYRKTNKKGFRI